VAHDGELRAELEAVFASADAEVWEAKINAAGVPASKLRTVFEACALPHLEERGLKIHSKMSEKDDRDITVLNTGFRTDWSGIDAPPPLLGQHTEEVLRGLGRTGDEIAALRQEGAIG
jgi:crotonobetainyl-CoA:carnitine CoA-transferase CaiB-like acyl-CoA transferase